MGEAMLSFIFPTKGKTADRSKPNQIIPVISNAPQEPKSVQIHASNAFHYFRIYLDVLYLVGFCPYRLRYNGRTKSWYIQHLTNMRKVACVALQLLLLLTGLSYYRAVVPQIKFKDHPTELFGVFNGLGYLMFYIPCLIYITWRKMGNLRAVLNISSRDKLETDLSGRSCRKETVISYLALSIAALGAILVANFSPYITVPVLEGSILGRLKAMAGLLEYNLYLRKEAKALGPDDELTPAFGALTVVYWLLSQYYSTLCFVFQSGTPMAALTFYSISKDFEKMLEPGTGIPSEKILEEYAVFKQLVKNLNALLSAALIGDFVTSLPYYPIQLIRIIDGEEKLSLIFVGIMVGSILTAAEANRRFAEFSNWLLQMGPGLAEKSDAHLTMLFIESTTSPLGLQAGGLFTISYKFIGAGLSVLATYVFIGLQFPSGSLSTGPTNLNSPSRLFEYANSH